MLGNPADPALFRPLNNKANTMAKTLKPGDKVSWGSSGGETHGTVEKKVTDTTHIKGHTAKATKKDPQFVVKSAKSGKTAVHKPTDLKKE